MMEQPIGLPLDRYQLKGTLGERATGAVVQAHDVAFNRNVAIRIVRPQFARRPDFRDRFLQAARIATQLDHPGIVKGLGYGHDRSLL